MPVQPSTPTVIPATPTPNRNTNASRDIRPSSPSAGSSNDIFYDAEEHERDQNSKRRSMYRSPGTASSPDLATLVRKAKQRGGVLQSHFSKDRRNDQPPSPLPSSVAAQQNSTGSPRNRQRSSTSSAQDAPSTPPGASRSKSARQPISNVSSPVGSEWFMASPKSAGPSGSIKVRGGPCSF